MAYSRLVILLASVVGACGSGPKHVVVSGTPGDLRFTVVAPEGASRACADELSVQPVVPEEADLTWQVSSVGPENCFDTLRYGELTANVTQKVPAIPLRPDVAYRVRISGSGFSVVRDFRITAEGVKVQD